MIEWFARNPVAANLLMVSIIVSGLLSLYRAIPFETFPSFEIERVSISTVLRGATPQAVEDSITNRIEEAIYDLEGVSEVVSQSRESRSLISAEVEEGYDKREILNDIKLRVDSLNTLPIDSEKPIVSLTLINEGVLQVAIIADKQNGPDMKTLRLAADKVQRDLLSFPEITLVNLLGATNYEISIEINPQTLENYGLTLQQISQAIRAGSADVSAGNIKTQDGDILVRTDGQAYTRSQFAAIPIINQLGADPILLGDIARINDGFEDQPLLTKFNGRTAIMMDVLRVGTQSSIDVANLVKSYIEQQNPRLASSGLSMEYWDDDSLLLKARMATLISSGLWGGLLVLLVLSLFLRPAVAFWVFLGVPVSFMGAFIFMPFVNGTVNILSLFAFITVLGIVVDDAIVTGENIYSKMRDGLEPIQASIIGTKEIAVPVTFGILTTVVAFYPMSNLGANRIGFMSAQIPMVVIPVLLFSLIESKLVLPSHLSHVKPRKEGAELNWLSRLQMQVARGFEVSVVKYYQPFLDVCIRNKAITLASIVSISSIIVTMAATGYVKFTFLPRVEGEQIKFHLVMPDTTGFSTTKRNVDIISTVIKDLQEKYRDPDTGISIIKHTYSTAGSFEETVKPSVGEVRAEIIDPSVRHVDITTTELAREILSIVGEIPGAEKLSVITEIAQGGAPILIEMSGATALEMRNVGNKMRQQLRQYPHVFDIQDNYSGGKEELNFNLRPRAIALGLTRSDIANQVRGSVFGFEAQRIQRGRDEVRVMVRLPEEYRSSTQDLANMPIWVNQNSEPVPLSDLVIFKAVRSPTTLFRLDRNPIISVSADVDKDNADVPAIIRELRQSLEQEKQALPNLRYAFKGEAEEQAENNAGFKSGAVLVLILIYALLAIPFKSYAQPFIVMSVIPFSMVGAVLGHMVTGYDLSMLSVVGMMALLGVVVNDSLVLVDYINRQRAEGIDVYQAVSASGAARFRPVFLTSITTFAGLTPLLLDNSTQVQFLIQMAISLGFGILFATIITLLMVPVNYILAYETKHGAIRLINKAKTNWLEFWHREDKPHVP